MNAGTLQGIGTVLAMAAFFSIVWWAYGSKRKARFEEAAMLPFAEDDITLDSVSEAASASARKPSQPAPSKPAPRSNPHE